METQIKDLIRTPTNVLADRYLISPDEATVAVSVMMSPQAVRHGIRFPCTTAGFRKLVNIKNGLWDLNGNAGQCIEMPLFYYDWYYNKLNENELVEFGKVIGHEQWRRCESTGLWFVGEKPFRTCTIESCRACEPFHRVYEGQNKLYVKFYFWDPNCRDFQSYLRFYQRFYLLFEKDKRDSNPPYDFRQARLLMVKRQAVGEFNFRYSLSDKYMKDYLYNHIKFAKMEQIIDFPLQLQHQLFNTVLNDTIIAATQDEVTRWIGQYKEDSSNNCWTETPPPGNTDQLDLVNPYILSDCYKEGNAGFMGREALISRVGFLTAVRVHNEVPIACRVSSFRKREFYKNKYALRKDHLSKYSNKYLYTLAKDDWYVHIPAGVSIFGKRDFESDCFDPEQEDGLHIVLRHGFQYRTGDKERHKGEKLYVDWCQMDNIDDYAYDAACNEEQDYYLIRIKVEDVLRFGSLNTQEKNMVPVDFFMSFGAWKKCRILYDVYQEIFGEAKHELFNSDFLVMH